MGDAGSTQGTSSGGVFQSGDTYRYNYSSFTWTSENVSSLFLDENIDDTINATIDVRLVKGDNSEQTYTASYIMTIPGTGHYYSFTTGGVATKELKWIEADCQ
jgi:hypothetical protein